jgi:hypothetical protein
LRFDFLIHVDFVTWLSIYFAVMLPALILTLAALLYRLLFVLAGAPFDWANFSPLASIFLCSGVFFATKRGALWPALGLLVSDVIINAYYHAPLIDTRMIPGYFCFGIIYLFLRNSLISDLLFTSFFLLTPALLRLHHASSDLPGHPTHPTL